MFTPGSRGYGCKTVSGRHEWPSKDPIGFDGGNNWYAYCGNDPVNHFDPNGKFWFIPIIAAGATLYAVVWNFWEQHENMKLQAEIANDRAQRGDIGALMKMPHF